MPLMSGWETEPRQESAPHHVQLSNIRSSCNLHSVGTSYVLCLIQLDPAPPDHA